MRAGAFIPQVQSLLGDPEGDFHTTEKVLLHLNTAIEDICTRSRTICSWLLIPAIEDQGRYGLPEKFLEFKFVGYYYQDQLLQLTPGGVADIAPAIFSDRNYHYGIPHTYADGGNAFLEKVVSTIETVETVGSAVIFSVTLDGHYPDIKIGDRFLNVTDDSEGVITTVGTENPTTVQIENINNGIDNMVEIDDEFRIVSRTEHRHSLSIAPPPKITDIKGEKSIYVFYAREHISITMENIENANDEIEVGTEWNSTLRHRVCYYAALEEKGIDNAQTISFDIKYETDYMKTFPKANRRIREIISTYRNAGRRIRPKTTISHAYDHSVRSITVE